eukprot:CAMPEP_0113303304 /NCGR_PEP_ID=MMETSP0010_2-20120614/3775_1 /TAXON_ID=216773 ORGANISM="Corethron hystrix, Strain 308" /NCGR_SAMPLE_ID=MMETSP0010_2 /ASSEMBLY_ACC=CAM_ASM_000155 /LENGTH=58 /DNA_ID=CAMNT_0000157277 /DNA_START=639 /DNA_END=815 /DNA_ORIENTATION=+ /assembly_acc=CAM_ASM_000155
MKIGENGGRSGLRESHGENRGGEFEATIAMMASIGDIGGQDEPITERKDVVICCNRRS